MTVFLRRVPGYRDYQAALRGRSGIEIGGPSPLFEDVLPIYEVVAGLDGANFARETIWEGRLEPGRTFRYHRGRLGTQLICEATRLEGIAPEAYDFVLANNCLEHVANPLQAVEEWRRVTRPRGHLLLVLPRKESNFDHRRPTTTLEHLEADHRNGVTERDLTHLEEILALHDLSRDPPAGTAAEFEARSRDNHANRCLHHHVFDLPLVRAVLERCGYEVLLSTSTATDHIALGRGR